MATSYDPSGIDAWIDASNPDDVDDVLEVEAREDFYNEW